MNAISKTGIRNPFYIFFWMVAFVMAVFVFFKPVMKLFYPVKYINIIEKYSDEYELNEHLVMAIISTESKFDKNAVSRKNAKGLMQLKEETALWCMEQFDIGSDGMNLHDPGLNIQVGCAYMRYLLDKFASSTNTALAAYNAGEGNVKKWLTEQGGELKSIPFKETKNYVESVNKRMKIYHFLY